MQDDSSLGRAARFTLPDPKARAAIDPATFTPPLSAAPSRDPSLPPPDGLVQRLRAVHLQMVEAVLGGDGLDRVARLAADAAGAPVAVVIPRLGALAVGGAPRSSRSRTM